MEHKRNQNKSGMKKLSDYIVSFAFLYSAFLCFSKAADIWMDNKFLSIVLLICGFFSFIAIFRFFIAKMIYFIKGKYFRNEKKF